jgi:hypothetical protein
MAASRFGGTYNANAYAYGCVGGPPALIINEGNIAAGLGVLSLEFGQVALEDGTSLAPLKTNAPIQVGIGSGSEIVTPTKVEGVPAQYANTKITANWAFPHGTGTRISSATFGLQEAINAAAAAGGGSVVADSNWFARGGTLAIIAAAVFPAPAANTLPITVSVGPA